MDLHENRSRLFNSRAFRLYEVEPNKIIGAILLLCVLSIVYNLGQII
jgi:hypothetical protein